MQNDEEIIWEDGINKASYFIKNSLLGLISSAICACFISFAYYTNPSFIYTTSFIKLSILLFIICTILILIGIYLSARNTFFAITNKRIIMRNGLFNNNFIHYSLKNIGTYQVTGGIFDKKGENGSANLIITVKDFHTNTDGNTSPERLTIISLKNAYKAYNILTEKIDGYNESLRVKIEK